MRIFDEIRSASRVVAERSTNVRIVDDRIPGYAASLPIAETNPQLDPAHHYLGREDSTVAFVITLDSINFGSGWFPHLRKLPELSGYFTIATRLTEYFHTNGPLGAEQLVALSATGCAQMLGQGMLTEPVAELMGLYARALNDLGRLLLAHYGGRFTALVETAGGSAEQLVGLLREMPFFEDVERHESLPVPFYKRAQLTAADLTLALGGEGLGHFSDLSSLTIFADNLVPHVLRLDGVLAYDRGLAERIDREDLIPAGSREEVEIRACALHAVELIVEQLHNAGRSEATAMSVDYLLWNRGQHPQYKRAKPRHRTRTVYY
jgi:hypothetical protein